MNILVVCRVLPYPPDVGYKIRTFNLLKYLSSKHNISLVCYASALDQGNHISVMEQYCKSIWLVQPEKRTKVKQLPGLAKNLISGLPWYVKYAKSKEMKDTILRLTKGNRFDLIHIDDPYMSSNLDVVSKSGVKKTVTFHDIESIKYQRILGIEKNLYKKIRFFLNWLPMQRWERRIAEKFDLNIVMSPVDRQILLSKNINVKIAVIPNGVDTDSLDQLPPTDQQENISFFGTMDYPPNIDAVLYFYKRVFQLIRRRLPETKFFIIGQKPTNELKKLSNDSNVIVTGYVKDIVPYYQKSSVVVVPLRAGGGTRLKILEAMGLGRPVVSTSLGSEGLEVTHSENIMIADRPEDFAKHTIELMTNKTLRTRLTEKARKFVESYHSWRKIAGDLDRVYQEICLGK